MAYKPYLFGKGTRSGGLATFVDYSTKPLSVSAQLQIAAAQKQGHSRSFWDNIKDAGKESLHPVEWTFDKILRPSYAISAAALAVAKDSHSTAWNRQHPLAALEHFGSEVAHGAARGFTGKEKHGFGQVLEQGGVLKGHRRLRGLAGFGLDVVADPITYLSGGTTIVAKSTEHAFAVAGGRRAITEAAGRKLTKGEVSLDDAISKTTKDVDSLTKMGKDYRYRRSLARINLRELVAAKNGEKIPPVYATRKRVIAAAAHAEEKRVEKFVPHYKLFGKKITPDIVGKSEKIGARSYAQGKQVIPGLPKLDKLIERGGVGSTTAARFREAFIRASSETPETHAMAITTKHISERITDEQFKAGGAALHGIARKIKSERQRQILHYFEKPPEGVKAVIKIDGVYRINPKYADELVAAGKLTDHERTFASNYQQVLEHVFHNEKAHGATTEHFSQTGRMYVPHLMDKEGVALNDQMRLLTTKAGFERARSDREFSLKELVDMGAKGDLPRHVVKDPFELLVSRLRASGRRQGELNQLDAMATIAGVKTRLVDAAKLDAHRNKRDNTAFDYIMKAAEHTDAAHTAITSHEKELDAARTAYNRIKFGKKNATKAANLARASAKIAKLEKRGPFMGDASERFAELQAFKKELTKLDKQEKQILKGKTNPEYKASMHTVADLKDAYGHPIALPDELGQAAQKIRRVMDGDDAAIKSFEAGYRKMLSRWKVLVTSINPGYRMRNSQTDLWNWWLKPGVNTYYMAKNLGKATKFSIGMKNIAKKIEKDGFLSEKNAQLLRDYEAMYDNGVLSGLFQGDVQTAAEILRLGHSKTALIRKARLLKFTEKAAQDMNRNGENWVRIAHFFWAKNDKGLSDVEAALSVKSAHFDYEDLTPFEQRRMKAIAPFYTWTRKNLPYQIKAIIQSPGKYIAFPKGAMEADYVANDPKGTIIPPFISKGWGVPIGGSNYIMPQLGVSDLQALDSKSGPKDRAMGLLTPAIKLPLELATNKNLFTGGPIASDTHSRNPVSPFGAALLRFVPGANVGATSRTGPGGDRIYGPGANPYLLHALGYLGPTANLLLNKQGGIKRKQMGPVSPLWSYGAGLSIQHIDQAQQQLLAQINFSDEAKKMLQDMRDEGLIPQAERPTGKQTRHVNKLINAEIGR